MCVVSMVMQHKYDEWYKRLNEIPIVPPIPTPILPSQQEIDEFRRLLERAREYDRQHNQPDCELEEKRKKLKELAELMGVEIQFV